MTFRHLLLACLVPATLAAQQPVTITLKPADATLRDSAVGGSSIRELRDGRVLLSNRGISVADLRTGNVERIPDAPSGVLVPLGGDSTLIEVGISGWIFLDGTRLLGMLPLNNAVVAATPHASASGMDLSGHVLSVAEGRPASDSSTAILIDRTTAKMAIATRLWGSPPVLGGQPAPTFVVNEMSILGLDGWMAVVRANPYRVDWRSPAGKWTLGAPIPVTPLKMDSRQQAAYWEYFGMAGSPNPVVWPEFVPPITYPMPMMTPDGKVLVKRWATAEYPNRYDVINRRGELEGQIVLKGLHDRIVGFGATTVYILTAPDRSGPIRGAVAQTLERHPWP
jgi:hypothetical protein